MGAKWSDSFATAQKKRNAMKLRALATSTGQPQCYDGVIFYLPAP
ncbi:hypothetical protein GBAG_0816 [Buttiauxella agrestis ATCC 33320]|uniref:Uncharacterized protein n=1 Tax=Buttiauxella agrestis ATCC 33320 TaxID=1006004 RepID=A0A085GI32_9ENTR|nr:hypothetical protein GBAG_0816 [Buttiauxella agrestis ATCC 33320]